LCDAGGGPGGPEVRAPGTAEGRSRFALPLRQVRLSAGLTTPWYHLFVMATARGFGPAVASVADPAAAGNQTLRLARDDVPIRGRILDLEGRSVAGAKVRIESLIARNKGDLPASLASLEASKDGFQSENEHLRGLYGQGIAALFPEVTADREGRFELRGVGRERVVNLTISGPTIETRQVRVRTRPGK